MGSAAPVCIDPMIDWPFVSSSLMDMARSLCLSALHGECQNRNKKKEKKRTGHLVSPPSTSLFSFLISSGVLLTFKKRKEGHRHDYSIYHHREREKGEKRERERTRKWVGWWGGYPWPTTKRPQSLSGSHNSTHHTIQQGYRRARLYRSKSGHGWWMHHQTP